MVVFKDIIRMYAHSKAYVELSDHQARLSSRERCITKDILYKILISGTNGTKEIIHSCLVSHFYNN